MVLNDDRVEPFSASQFQHTVGQLLAEQPFVSYLFVDANEFTQVYQNHPDSSDKQRLEILTLAVNEVCKAT